MVFRLMGKEISLQNKEKILENNVKRREKFYVAR